METASRDRFDCSIPLVRAHRYEKVAYVDVVDIQDESKWIVPDCLRCWDLRRGKSLLQAVRLENEPDLGVAVGVFGTQVLCPCDYDVEKVLSVRARHARAGARLARCEQMRVTNVTYLDVNCVGDTET